MHDNHDCHLFVILGIWGVALIVIYNYLDSYQEWTQAQFEEYESVSDLYVTTGDLAFFFGQFVSVLWLVAFISRCCAPCCCELPDVECPCSPCKLFHAMDLCFFVGFFVAMFPVNAFKQPEFSGHFLGTPLHDFVLALGILMMLAATILGFVKFLQMLKKNASYTTPTVAPAQPPQVVGSAVVVQATAVESNEPV